MAQNVARRSPDADFDICKSRFDHGPWPYSASNIARKRKLDASYLWTVIRDPTKRATSEFFHFEVSRKKVDPTDVNFKEWLLSDDKLPDYYLQALYTDTLFNRDKMDPIKAANKILAEFNFIGISERMDESAVVLMMLLDLPMSDVLYLSAKGSGGYDDAGGRGACTMIWKSFLSPGMKEFFASDVWSKRNVYDLEFYRAANASMDLTIDLLGRDAFEANLQKYRHALEIAAERCLPTTMPCDEGGNYHNEEETDCIWKDSGCGIACLDKVAEDLGLA